MSLLDIWHGRYRITVDTCIDSDEFVWTIFCDGNDLMDGYEASQEDAYKKARQALKEHLAEIE